MKRNNKRSNEATKQQKTKQLKKKTWSKIMSCPSLIQIHGILRIKSSRTSKMIINKLYKKSNYLSAKLKTTKKKRNIPH